MGSSSLIPVCRRRLLDRRFGAESHDPYIVTLNHQDALVRTLRPIRKAIKGRYKVPLR